MKSYVKKNIEICNTKESRRGTPAALYQDRYAMIVALLTRFCRTGKPLLDVGAREGFLLDALQERGFKELTGLDIWQKGIDTMSANGHRTIRADIQEYRSHKRFHTIVLSHVLEHCPDPVKVLDNVNHMLKKHGFVYIEVPRQDDLRIDKAGHYSNFPEPDDLLDILPEHWKQRFFGWCPRRIYYLGSKYVNQKGKA